MEFFEALQRRRSIRKYTDKPIPNEVVTKAIDAALIAPNSSNMQTWRIYWVSSPEKKKKLVEACLSQSAARTAKELFVFVADRSVWKTSQQAILNSLGANPRKDMLLYYNRLIPFTYGYLWLAPFKWIASNVVGLFRPIPRSRWSARDISEVCIKSCALACENFMLAMSAQGFDTCPMEGFDEVRVKRLLGLGCSARVVMVISAGERQANGVWGEQFRLPKETVFHKI